MSMAALLNGCLADPLASARAQRRAGGRVVGYVSADIPVELILAAGAHPLLLPGSSPGTPTPQADEYLEPTFAPLERSIAQQWLTGGLDALEYVVLSRARDSSQRLYYYMCELQRRGLCPHPTPLLYDLSKIDRPTSLAYAEQSTRRLARELSADLNRLAESIERRNRLRELLQEVQRLRRGPRPPSGVAVEHIARAMDRCEGADYEAALQDWLRKPDTLHTAARVILAGSAPPDDRLHAAVERAGGVVVAEFGDHALTRLGAPIASDRDPVEAVALHYHQLRYGPRAFVDRTSQLLRVVRSVGATGVIVWLLEEEEALVWELPAQILALQRAGVPLSILTRRRWDAADGALEAIDAFVHQLRGSHEAA